MVSARPGTTVQELCGRLRAKLQVSALSTGTPPPALPVFETCLFKCRPHRDACLPQHLPPLGSGEVHVLTGEVSRRQHGAAELCSRLPAGETHVLTVLRVLECG